MSALRLIDLRPHEQEDLLLSNHRDFATWAAAYATPRQECPACEGFGKDASLDECEECEGEGYYEARARKNADIWGYAYDAGASLWSRWKAIPASARCWVRMGLGLLILGVMLAFDLTAGWEWGCAACVALCLVVSGGFELVEGEDR